MAILYYTASRNGGNAGAPATDNVRALVLRDEKTGESYLRLPVPQPDVLEQALKAVGTLLESLRK